jgi:hypothetical protein
MSLAVSCFTQPLISGPQGDRFDCTCTGKHSRHYYCLVLITLWRFVWCVCVCTGAEQQTVAQFTETQNGQWSGWFPATWGEAFTFLCSLFFLLCEREEKFLCHNQTIKICSLFIVHIFSSYYKQMRVVFPFILQFPVILLLSSTSICPIPPHTNSRWNSFCLLLGDAVYTWHMFLVFFAFPGS